MANEITFIDLFGGAGGFRLGLARASRSYQLAQRAHRQVRRDDGNSNATEQDAESINRHEESSSQNRDGSVVGRKRGESRTRGVFSCVYYCDVDRYAVATYNRHFKERWRPTNVRRVRVAKIPTSDLLCAGFPCQSFSLAGRRKGFEDTRGTLFFEIARIAQATRPRLLLLENVLGLLSHDDGQTFETILRVLDEMGYDAEWQVLNSKHFGVPQNRERIFLVGHLREIPYKEIFPLPENGPSLAQGSSQSETPILRTFTAGGHSGGLHSAMTAIIDPSHKFHDRLRLYTRDGPTIPTASGGHLPFVANAVTVDAWLMDTRHHYKQYHEYRIRRLTPLECERLQGFPDGWTKGVSDTQRYKMMGNAVTVNVVAAIGERILELS